MNLNNLTTKVKLIQPDKTFYESIKGISLENDEVSSLNSSDLSIPKSLKLSKEYIRSWRFQHAPLIEKAFENIDSKTPFRTIFPGPYIPALDGELINIGDFAQTVYANILKSIKQRIPHLKKLKKNGFEYSYESSYKPILRTISEPEEAWGYQRIKCPRIQGVNFPLPPTYEYEPEDTKRLERVKKDINKKCSHFCQKHLGKKKERNKNHIIEILSYISSVQNLMPSKISTTLIKSFNEVLSFFDLKDCQPENPMKFLFEVHHALSYLIQIKNFPLLFSGSYATYWVDCIQLPLENLVEAELCDIHRVLREIRSYFSVGWSLIIVHLDGKLGFNTDGTHRHYALLTVELLRRLRSGSKESFRKMDLNSDRALKIITEFSDRYNKKGLSLRETLRVVSYIVNSDSPWPYLDILEDEIRKSKGTEIKYVPVIYLPEWRARSVVKNLCDKGIALVGVPVKNIFLIGRSKGKKGIFIRGGYHGTDRQPMLWLNYLDIQKL